jgi:hypothetical protein
MTAMASVLESDPGARSSERNRRSCLRHCPSRRPLETAELRLSNREKLSSLVGPSLCFRPVPRRGPLSRWAASPTRNLANLAPNPDGHSGGFVHSRTSSSSGGHSAR